MYDLCFMGFDIKQTMTDKNKESGRSKGASCLPELAPAAPRALGFGGGNIFPSLCPKLGPLVVVDQFEVASVHQPMRGLDITL